MSTRYLTWRKSRRSEAGSECVEVSRSLHGSIGVRDSKQGETGPIIELTQAGWVALIRSVRSTAP
ncbi:DUF397 domain-containing protein [Spirillospora sp. CA-294931]|uniref:DUF397 domain-containing protein n=1 Tax=Spirillospora sp. CA-294931 TaxID=3240042 RepID=UPI003D8C6025